MLVGILQQQIIQEIQGKIHQQYLRDQLQRMKWILWGLINRLVIYLGSLYCVKVDYIWNERKKVSSFSFYVETLWRLASIEGNLKQNPIRVMLIGRYTITFMDIEILLPILI